MNKMNLIVSSIMGLVLSSGLNAQGPKIDCDQFDINSITYIEDEPDVDLGFNPMDYLPENFNPHGYYIDLDSIDFIEDDMIYVDSENHLPESFEAYANPSDFRSINYIDPNDEITFDLDVCEFLPEGFDPYARTSSVKVESL